MRKIILIISLMTTFSTFTSGQTVPDSISMIRIFGGYQFFQGEKKLNMQQLVSTVKPNEQAYIQIKSAESTYTLAMIFGCAGGFMVGWPIGTAIGGGEPNWAMAGVGAGLIAISIPITHKFNKQAKLAVDTYNNGINTSSFWEKGELKIVMTCNGIGLKMRF